MPLGIIIEYKLYVLRYYYEDIEKYTLIFILLEWCEYIRLNSIKLSC